MSCERAKPLSTSNDLTTISADLLNPVRDEVVSRRNKMVEILRNLDQEYYKLDEAQSAPALEAQAIVCSEMIDEIKTLFNEMGTMVNQLDVDSLATAALQLPELKNVVKAIVQELFTKFVDDQRRWLTEFERSDDSITYLEQDLRECAHENRERFCSHRAPPELPELDLYLLVKPWLPIGEMHESLEMVTVIDGYEDAFNAAQTPAEARSAFFDLVEQTYTALSAVQRLAEEFNIDKKTLSDIVGTYKRRLDVDCYYCERRFRKSVLVRYRECRDFVESCARHYVILLKEATDRMEAWGSSPPLDNGDDAAGPL
ncbi:hypothetical protein CC80DRAFT_556556 [Byssothecium circinans]|uniref:Uncharacterized protein n=1 Tax=Byssothecium circinans TaxID=147558 RepID=A0A6A5T7U8_9PLEO|nr:hypothetical protein CC80DRAFT_556556 [Byssothecium circinans]